MPDTKQFPSEIFKSNKEIIRCKHNKIDIDHEKGFKAIGLLDV